MLKIKVKDKVKVRSGKDKGREGVVEKIFPKENKVLVDGINLYKRHVKGVYGQKPGIYEIPRPLYVSQISLICPRCSKPTRVGFSLKEGKKVRFCKKCKSEID